MLNPVVSWLKFFGYFLWSDTGAGIVVISSFAEGERSGGYRSHWIVCSGGHTAVAESWLQV
jgi:hypothetical protein